MAAAAPCSDQWVCSDWDPVLSVLQNIPETEPAVHTLSGPSECDWGPSLLPKPVKEPQPSSKSLSQMYLYKPETAAAELYYSWWEREHNNKRECNNNIQGCFMDINECIISISKVRDLSDVYLSWTWGRIGQSCFKAVSESSQSCKINFTILWVFWSTDEIILQSFSASFKCSWFFVSVKSRAEQQEKSSLLWRAERRTSAVFCWRSEELQQWSSFSISSLSTLNHTQVLLTNTHAGV